MKNGKIKEEVTLLATQGCDNNEAGVKFRAYLESENIKTHMIATDINPNSPTLSRVLDALLRERNPQLEEAEIVLNDFFSENPLLMLKKECQTIFALL